MREERRPRRRREVREARGSRIGGPQLRKGVTNCLGKQILNLAEYVNEGFFSGRGRCTSPALCH